MTKFKPMLASPVDVTTLRFPVYASPKLDGIRASVVDGKLLTRSLKEVPNRHVFNSLSQRALNGLDGELIVGPPHAKDVYRQTVSGIMTHAGVPEVTYYLFDLCNEPVLTFSQRLKTLVHVMHDLEPFCTEVKLSVLEQRICKDMTAVDAYEAECLDLGYEGIILRDPTARYKFGRSTASEQALLKVKRFEDSEARIKGVEEEMHNANVATTNALGYTERSSHQANLIGKGTMGALLVEDIYTGVEFKIGTGFTAAERAQKWNIGDIVKYRFLPVGVKDKPRHPSYLGLRDRKDM